ncbi:MAG: hypothetical protein QM750_15285 [Rubrivivax sp.]
MHTGTAPLRQRVLALEAGSAAADSIAPADAEDTVVPLQRR